MLKFRGHRGGNTPFDTVTSLQHTSLILDINVMLNWHLSKQGIHWPVSCDHITGSSWTLSRSAVFSKLTSDQGLVVDWIGGLRSDQTHTHTPERGLIFRALSVAPRGYKAIQRQQKLLAVDAFHVQVWFGKYIFLAFFAGFSPGLTLYSCGQDTLVATYLFKSSIGAIWT